ncbi:MAG: hypothetical protein QOJ80_4419 [Mycobacterium sp.]|jgi:2-polyprenyl-6-methoxyphenol hydroxylase-like FAD-dependent oxidoreductase|nr:hypothetical protein [Mycobacterium sp.]
MTEHAVVIAGGGPTGLVLGAELALAGVDVAIVERRTSHDVEGSRAGGLTSRTLEVLDQRGVADRFLEMGWTAEAVHYSGIFLDVSDFPTRHSYVLGLAQYRIERILADWVAELGVPVHYGREVEAFTQHDAGVVVGLSGGQALRAAYLVGCDGGRSAIRKMAGIEFPGWDPSTSCLVADVQTTAEPEWGIHRDGGALHVLARIEGGGPTRVLVTEPEVGRTDVPTLRDVSTALIAARGTDYGMHSATWISRFTDVTRQAVSYRAGRVLLAGDAAHVHFPIGGQGLNTGIQDAVNLGWKLAQVVEGTSDESLLDTYHAERHPVAARVLRNTMAQTALSGPGERIDALRDTMSELLVMEEPRKRIGAMMTGLDIHYDLGEGHPLLGRRMPDLDVVTPNGPRRVYSMLNDARPILLNLDAPLGLDLTPWAQRLRLVDAKYAGDWELPVLGRVSASSAVLIRPDGYVGWVGAAPHQGLAEALNRWCGYRSTTTSSTG